MSQQLQQPPSQQHSQFSQPSYQAQSQAGQQFQQRTSGFVGGQYEQQLPQESQKAIADLDRLANVAEWAKTKVAKRGMPQAIRICDDIEDLAHLEKKLILRESPFAQPIGQAVVQTIQQNLQELQQYVNQPEVQETLHQTQQTLGAIQQGVSRLQQFGQQGGMQGQQGGTQSQPSQQSQQFY